MKFIVNKTYATVTPESAEIGDYADSGIEFEEEPFTFNELVKEMRRYSEPSCHPVTVPFWVSSEPETDFRTGEETTYALHLDGRHATPRAWRYWTKAWALSRA